MYQNFSSFLSNSLRILNIANRVIPLVRDMNPQIVKVRNTLRNIRTGVSSSLQNNNFNVPQQQQQLPGPRVNNSLTFFR